MATAQTPSTDEAREDAFTEDTMRKYFAGQKKIPVKPRDDQFVQVNGYTFILKGGERCEVPEDIYNILDEAGRI